MREEERRGSKVEATEFPGSMNFEEKFFGWNTSQGDRTIQVLRERFLRQVWAQIPRRKAQIPRLYSAQKLRS